MVLSEIGNFFLAIALGFMGVQVLASFGGTLKDHSKFLMLGRVAAFLQGGCMGAAFVTLMLAFWVCDFSIATVAFHDHTQLPWYYRLAATWGNHEGSLLLFVLILSGMSVGLGMFIRSPLLRAHTLSFQGLLTLLFLIFLIMTSNPFTLLPLPFPEGISLNPLLQDHGLLSHPPLLYLGYVGFSAPFSMALAALWGGEKGTTWEDEVRPWVLFAWGALTAGILLGSWWAYYELGWGGWWFWDPVENISFMPWLAATALLHTLRTGTLYRWSLFLSLLAFGLSLLGTFLVRSNLITTVHSFAQNAERGHFLLWLLGGVTGFSLLMWVWKAPRLRSPPIVFFSRQGALLASSCFLCVGLAVLFFGTLYPLWSEWMWQEKVAVGAPYFERTLLPLMVPLLIFFPIGIFLRDENEAFFPLLIAPLTAVLGASVLLLYIFYPLSLWAFTGITMAIWVGGGTVVGWAKDRLSSGAFLAHLGVAISLLGVSVGGGFRIDETRVLGLKESFNIAGTTLTLQDVQRGKTPTYLYEKAILTSKSGTLRPEKRLYQPQNSLVSETAILTNGLKDLYVILGPYQGDNRWLIRASFIPLAPWIWGGGVLMVLGAIFSLIKRKKSCLLFFLLFPTVLLAESALETRAQALYKEVRCPVCAGQSIADSEVPESKGLRGFIVEQLNEGKSEATIRDELRTLFGNDILFRPPLTSKTIFLWLAPFGLFFLVLLGFLWKGYHSRAK